MTFIQISCLAASAESAAYNQPLPYITTASPSARESNLLAWARLFVFRACFGSSMYELLLNLKKLHLMCRRAVTSEQPSYGIMSKCSQSFRLLIFGDFLRVRTGRKGEMHWCSPLSAWRAACLQSQAMPLAKKAEYRAVTLCVHKGNGWLLFCLSNQAQIWNEIIWRERHIDVWSMMLHIISSDDATLCRGLMRFTEILHAF